VVYCFSVTEENKMPTNTALSTQQVSISFASQTAPSPLQRVRRALTGRSRTRFASIAGLSFALSFPVLGIVDPKVLMASGLSNAHSVESLFQRADVALRNLDVLGAFATGGVAVLALAAMAGVGYLRSRYKEARELPATK
jgi:hypothetical protein